MEPSYAYVVKPHYPVAKRLRDERRLLCDLDVARPARRDGNRADSVAGPVSDEEPEPGFGEIREVRAEGLRHQDGLAARHDKHVHAVKRAGSDRGGVHGHGLHTLLHSCGHTEDRIECYIDAGFDFWSPQSMNDIGKLYDDYGDRIIFAVWPEEKDLAQRTEEEQRAAARRFVDRFCQPGKPSVMAFQAIRSGTPAFMDEVYIYSRAKFLAE